MQLEMPLARAHYPTKGGWHHDQADWKPKTCSVCSVQFKPRGGAQKFCSVECKGKAKYQDGRVTTQSQYDAISGNWSRYLSRLLYSNGRKRVNLTRDDLLNLLEKQEYKCALSGEPLTCTLSKAEVYLTNASIDQIVPSAGYTLDNIRLVQRIYNIMKWTQSDAAFIEACRKVVEYYGSKT